MNPRNDLGETSCKEERAREKERKEGEEEEEEEKKNGLNEQGAR